MASGALFVCASGPICDAVDAHHVHRGVKMTDEEYQEWLNDPKAQQEYQEFCLKEALQNAGLSVEQVMKVTEQFFKEQQK